MSDSELLLDTELDRPEPAESLDPVVSEITGLSRIELDVSTKIKAKLTPAKPKPEPELIAVLGKDLPETEKNWPDFLIVFSPDPEVDLREFIRERTGHKPIKLGTPFTGDELTLETKGRSGRPAILNIPLSNKELILVHPDGIPPLEALCKLNRVKPHTAIHAERKAVSAIKKWLDRLEKRYHTGERQKFFYAPRRAALLP